MIRGRAGAAGSAHPESPLGGLSRDRRSPELARLLLLSPSLKCLSHPGRGAREEAGPGGAGEEAGASGPGRAGGEAAGRRAGALASRARGSPLGRRGRRSPRLPSSPPAAGEPGGRQRLPRAAARPLGATKAGCSQINPTWSQAPPGRRSGAPELGCLLAGLPRLWDRRLTSTRLQPAPGTRVRGLPPHRPLPGPGCGDPHTLGTSVRERAPAPGAAPPRKNTYTQTRTQPAPRARSARTREAAGVL